MNRLKDFVVIAGQEYLVSTVYTFDAGWETMVFASKNHEVVYWADLYVRRYSTMVEAFRCHGEIVNKLNSFKDAEVMDWNWMRD